MLHPGQVHPASIHDAIRGGRCMRGTIRSTETIQGRMRMAVSGGLRIGVGIVWMTEMELILVQIMRSGRQVGRMSSRFLFYAITTWDDG